MLPLLRAINNHSPSDQLTAILHANPQAAMEFDDFLRLPLHYAIGKKLDDDFIFELLQYFPQAASATDKNGQYPLHVAIKRSSSEALITRVYNAYPDAISAIDEYGLTPLHHAIEVDASAVNVQLLLKLNVNCASDRFGHQIPLQVAIELKRFDLVPFLLAAYPAGAVDTESEGKRLPLQAAIHARAPYAVLMCLFNAAPQAAATVVDGDDMMAIHYAVKYHEPVELVAKLISLNPAVVYLQNLPIYLNAIEAAEFKKKQLVLRQDSVRNVTTPSKLEKESSWQSNSPINKNSPLSRNSFRKRLGPFPIPIVEEVVDDLSISAAELKSSNFHALHEPGGPISRRAIRGKTLLNFAVEIAQASDDVVAEILIHTMPISHVDGSLNAQHNYCWSYILSSTEDKYWTAVELVLEKYDRSAHLDLVRKLSETPDEIGRKAIDIATPLCRQTLLRRLFFFIRYELFPLPYKHISDQSIVQLARDHHDNKRVVALKFMKNRLHFDREVHVRSNTGLHTDYAIEVLRWHDSDADPSFKDAIARSEKAAFPYCIVMVAAERELIDAFYHENFAGGRNWPMLSLIAKQICEAVAHLHEWGLIHGDLRRK